MSNTPVFDAVLGLHPPTIPVTVDYTDRYTPEVARNEGALYGAESMRELILKLARAVPKPTKQIQDLIQKIEAIEYE